MSETAGELSTNSIHLHRANKFVGAWMGILEILDLEM